MSWMASDGATKQIFLDHIAYQSCIYKLSGESLLHRGFSHRAGFLDLQLDVQIQTGRCPCFFSLPCFRTAANSSARAGI